MSERPAGERTVIFADLAGFTALTEAHGDGDAADVAARFFELTSDALVADARIVKTIGDAVMLVVSDPVGGAHAALALLRSVEAEPRCPGVRIGLHAGPVVEREGDVFGATVNLAARLAADPAIGEVLTTQIVADQLTDANVVIEATGERSFHNIIAPVNTFAIMDRERQPTNLVHDPVCHMLVDPEGAPARLPYLGQSWWFCSLKCARGFAEHPESCVS